MGKQKINHSVAKQGENQIYQVSHEEDDNLLPSAEELLKYQALDSSMIDWIKDRCDREQIGRIDFNNEKVKIQKSVNNKLFTIDMTTIITSAVVVMSGMSMSAYLMYLGQVLYGSVFGGSIIVFYGIKILDFRKNKDNQNK